MQTTEAVSETAQLTLEQALPLIKQAFPRDSEQMVRAWHSACDTYGITASIEDYREWRLDFW